jgi:hypothetical protein
MLNASNTHSLLGLSNFSVCLVRPDGDLLYMNSHARALFCPSGPASGRITRFFAIESTWSELVTRVSGDEPVGDEPVLMNTASTSNELSFLTLLPQRNSAGEVDALLCVWATRRNALADHPESLNTEGVDEYTRDLEAILEHRTYRQLILGDLLEHSRKALDVLSVGILIADATGRILYHNHAVADAFGFRRTELPEPNVRYLLTQDQQPLFARVLRTGFRESLECAAPDGSPLLMEFLPLIEQDDISAVVIQYTRAILAPLTA